MRKYIFTAITTAALVFSTTALAQSEKEVKDKAEEAMSAGDYEAAGRAYEELYDITDDRAYLKKAGQAYIKRGPQGRERAMVVLRKYVAKAKFLEEAKEGSTLLAEATALPEPAPPVAPEPPPPPPPPVAPPPPPTPAPVVAPPTSVATPDTPKPAGEDGDEEGQSDHLAVVGSVAIGWYGVSDIPLATGAPAGSNDDPDIAGFGKESIAAPALGIRYWFTETLGLDVALGLHYSTGSASFGNTSADKQSRFGLLIHAGLPISPWHGDHYAIVIIPELNLGVASSGVSSPPGQSNAPPDASLSGVRFDAGGRAGMELHFGFMGIPQLSLEATVGAYLTVQGVGASVGNVEASQSDIVLTTASYDSPWDIFKNNVAARYYF